MDKEITPKEFIKENHEIITIIGVFGALAAIFIQIKQSFVALFALMLFLLLCWELWISFPKSENATLRVVLFESFFVFFAGGILAYVLNFVYVENKQLSSLFNLLLFLIYLGAGLFLFKNFELFNFARKLAPDNSKISPIIRGLIFIDVLLIIIIVYYFTIKSLQHF